MKVTQKLRVVGSSWVSRDANMITHRSYRMNIDLVALRSNTETVDDGLIRFGIGSQEKLTLRTAPGEHVIFTRANWASLCHTLSIETPGLCSAPRD